MADDKQNNLASINVEKGVKYSEEYDLYTIQMRRRRFPWWIFLLLLPLLLFIKCTKDVEVTCYEQDTDFVVRGQEVNLEYTSHFLFNNGRFFDNEDVKRTEVTDTAGVAVFRDLPCSVYSYIFYCLSKMHVWASDGECYMGAGDLFNFHYRRHVSLELPPRRVDLNIKLLDLETNDPLPDGYIIYKYHELDKEMTDSAHADALGIVTLPQMRYCSVTELMLGRCYGYADTTRVNYPNKHLIHPGDSATMRLRPLKERFTFFVKNAQTKQPIPAAVCQVSLRHPSGSIDGPHTVTTSIDGKGIAMYDEAFVLSVIGIVAHKEHYRDSILTGGPWTVENFIKQPDSVRTIWLEPLPFTQEFVNVDSISGKPVPGARNLIRVTAPDGTVTEYEEIGNRNGVFPVSATEDSRVEIISTKDDYYPKKTEIPLFKEAERRIPMSPIITTYSLDIVLVIDCTGSMDKLLSLVQSNARKFHSDLRARCEGDHKEIENMRIRVIGFRDFTEDGARSIEDSGFIPIPANIERFNRAVNSLTAEGGGGSEEESGLEALALAINSPWNRTSDQQRHIIMLWTDASTWDLGKGRSNPTYPSPMPANFTELTSWWNTKMDRSTKRLILFAPSKSAWPRIGSSWDNTMYFNWSGGAVGASDYEKILSTIIESL